MKKHGGGKKLAIGSVPTGSRPRDKTPAPGSGSKWLCRERRSRAPSPIPRKSKRGGGGGRQPARGGRLGAMTNGQLDAELVRLERTENVLKQEQLTRIAGGKGMLM